MKFFEHVRRWKGFTKLKPQWTVRRSYSIVPGGEIKDGDKYFEYAEMRRGRVYDKPKKDR